MDVLVIGAGASGLVAALTAAEAGARVTVLEKNSQAGKKLGITGNGRCNLSNRRIDGQSFRGTSPEFALKVLEQFSVEDTVRFFSDLGVEIKERDGALYPRSEQAAQIVQILTEEAAFRKVKCKYQTDIHSIEKKKEKFLVHTNGWIYEGDACILATGSKAAPDTGADGSGFVFAKALGHSILPVYPALTGLKVEKSLYPRLSGLRCEGEISLNLPDAPAVRGELQFTSYGISGIPVFQVSRYAVRAWESGKKVRLTVNFLPELSEQELYEFLTHRVKKLSHRKASGFLAGMFPQKLIGVLLEGAGIPAATPVASFSREEIDILSSMIHRMPADMTGHMGFSHSQAASGGVSTREICPYTMESLLVPGLYFAGEIVDIDGACGGYNLQWAWSSGHCAGLAAGSNHRL